jgi:cell division transport system permease protein
MSTIEPTSGADEPAAGGTDAAAHGPPEALPRFETPIVPKATIAGRALVAVIAIMTFLAALTTGAVLLVRAAAVDWQSEVAREVTIQIRPTSGRDIEADVAVAAAIARATRGIVEVRPLSRAESARLLEPWLGTGLALDDLPIPRMIIVRLASGVTPDLGRLRNRLAAEVPGASLDDHRSFIERMRAMARMAVIGGAGVLLLVLLATVLSVAFATRGAMATNRPVIEVLFFIGAKTSFIAGHFQRRFLMLGLQGGLIGGGSALALFALAQLAARWFPGPADGDQFAAMFGAFSVGIAGYVAVLAQIALIALVTAATARVVVNRTLQTIR